MLTKIFWTHPYLEQLSALITAVEGARVRVDQTIFYAESGGQESDHGTIGGISVIRAEKAGADIDYTLAENPPWRVGDAVLMVIDGRRRYRLMRLHFAAELVLEIIMRDFADKTIEKIGAHIGENKARIDFYFPVNIADIFPQLQAQVEAIIANDLPIISDFADRKQGWRYWAIEGFAQVPCGGTHLRRTSEIGKIAFKRKNIGKNKERIEIYLHNPDLELI